MATLQNTRGRATFLALALVFTLLTFPSTANASSFTPRNGACELVAFSGAGLPNDPYLIETADQFAEVGDCGAATGSNYNNPWAGNLNSQVPFFMLTENIDMSGQPSTPLVRPGSSFAAQETKVWLDGQGFEITNIEISSTSGNVGLFAQLVGASISNLILSGEASSTGGDSVGLLAGFARESTFSNIVSQVSISGDVSTKAVGGLIGRSRGNTISKVWVGPLADGASVRSDRDGNSSNISSGVGGVVGFNQETNYARPWFMRETIATVNVTASAGIPAGGIIGHSSNASYPFQMISTHYEGKVHSSLFAGGLVGRLAHAIESFLIASSSSQAEVSGGGSLGGLVGFARANQSTDHIRIVDSIATGTVSSTLDASGAAGGIVGRTEGTFGGVTVHGSYFEGDIRAVASSTTIKLGGVIGYADVINVSTTGARGSIVTTGGNNAYVGGMAGDMFYRATGTSVVETFASVSVSSNLIAGSPRAGGFVGLSTQLQSGTFSDNYFDATVSATAAPSLASYNPALASAANTADASDFVGWSIDEFANRQTTSDPWVMCQSPVPSQVVAPSSCPLTARYGRLGADGRSLTLWMNGPISVLPSPQSFAVDGTSVGQSIVTLSDSVISITLSSPVLSGTAPILSYVKPAQFPLASTKVVSPEAPSFGSFAVINGSVLSGPSVTNISVDNLTPTSFDLTFQCGGSCDPSASFTYLTSITPDGGASTNRSSASQTNTATLQLNNLSPNQNHVISVTVIQGGITSPLATVNVQTPKPIATISALTVADTNATLTVGCTNCGASPSSFTVSATPQGGGAAITSNTNVISGLQSETTYSFAVVIAFAGTTSDSVNWQSNPVRTLPFVPIISAVSPAAVPLTGGAITVTGSNFTSSTELSLAGTTLSFTVVNGTTITFTAPSDTAGSYDLAITNPVGTYTLSNAITYVPGPSLTSNSPTLATTNGGTIVTLTGTDLSTTTQVNVGSTTVSFSVVSDTTVRFVTAATSAGIVDVGVVTVGGVDTLSNAIEFTTSALVPVVTSITPATGPVAGGTTVTITGEFFSGSYSDSVSAAINGVSGSSLVLIDDSTLTFVTPAGSAGAFDLTVVTGGGLGTLPAAFTYTAPPPSATTGRGAGPAVVLTTPEITNFSTRELPTSGGEVRAEGRRLSGITDLALGGIAVTIVTNTDTLVVFMVGAVPEGIWDLRLVADNGTLTFQQAITIVGQEVVLESTPGTLLGYTMTLRFTSNNRTLSVVQERNLTGRLERFSSAETIICWGYTTAANPNAWAIAHATARAKAACDFAVSGDSSLKSVVRLRYGVSKDFAMRAALQFWR